MTAKTSSVRAQRRALYPANWRDLRQQVQQRAGNCCEGSPAYPECRAENGKPHPVTGSKVVLTTAHLHEDDTLTQDIERLRFWCQRCHLTYDAAMHARHAAQTRLLRRGGADDTPAIDVEQRRLWLVQDKAVEVEEDRRAAMVSSRWQRARRTDMRRPVSDVELTAMQARADAATVGPWQWTTDAANGEVRLGQGDKGFQFVYLLQGCPRTDVYDRVVMGLQWRDVAGDTLSGAQPGPNDREFISHARMDIPRLINEVKRLRARLQAIEGVLAADDETIDATVAPGAQRPSGAREVGA